MLEREGRWGAFQGQSPSPAGPAIGAELRRVPEVTQASPSATILLCPVTLPPSRAADGAGWRCCIWKHRSQPDHREKSRFSAVDVQVRHNETPHRGDMGEKESVRPAARLRPRQEASVTHSPGSPRSRAGHGVRRLAGAGEGRTCSRARQLPVQSPTGAAAPLRSSHAQTGPSRPVGAEASLMATHHSNNKEGGQPPTQAGLRLLPGGGPEVRREPRTRPRRSQDRTSNAGE